MDLPASNCLPYNLKPHSIFINKGAVVQLIRKSNVPKAKELCEWLDHDVIPDLAVKGSYDVSRDAPPEKAQQMHALGHLFSGGEAPTTVAAPSQPPPTFDMAAMFQLVQKQANDAAMAVYDARLAEERIRFEREKKEAVEKTVAIYDARIAELNARMEREFKRLEEMYQKNLAIEKQSASERYSAFASALREKHTEETKKLELMISQLQNKMYPELVVRSVLARDNIAENDKMRESLSRVTGRVVPDLSEMPRKETFLNHCRLPNGERRVIRAQREHIDKVFEPATSSSRKRKATFDDMAGAEVIRERKCAHPIAMWNRLRTKYSHYMYGIRFTNRSKTRYVPLNEEELLEKYREDLRMCEKDREKDQEKIAEFKALGIQDEKDLLRRCFYPDTLSDIEFWRLFDQLSSELDDETTPTGKRTRPENVYNIYTWNEMVNIFFDDDTKSTTSTKEAPTIPRAVDAAPPTPPTPAPSESG
jgi:hypothetical protein